MRKVINTIILSCLAISGVGQAKTDKSKEEIAAVCDRFMQNFRDGKISEALQLMKTSSVIEHSKIDTLEVTISDQLAIILPAYGNTVSYEFISERSIKDFLTRRFYILKFEKYYLKFDFTIYKTTSGWKITSFNYDEDLTEVLH